MGRIKRNMLVAAAALLLLAGGLGAGDYAGKINVKSEGPPLCTWRGEKKINIAN